MGVVTMRADSNTPGPLIDDDVFEPARLDERPRVRPRRHQGNDAGPFLLMPTTVNLETRSPGLLAKMLRQLVDAPRRSDECRYAAAALNLPPAR